MIAILLEYGADLSHFCFNKSLREHLKAILPNYDPDAVRVKKEAKKASDHDVKMWQLSALIERYSISVDENEKKDIYNEFLSILSTMDPTKGDFFGPAKNSLLHKACYEALPNFANDLLRLGFASADEMTERSEMPCLMIAALRGNLQLMKLLIDHGASIQNAVRKDIFREIYMLIRKSIT